jgi:hypothetical protein
MLGSVSGRVVQPMELHDMRQPEDGCGPGRSARRSSSGSAIGRAVPKRPGARRRALSTAVQRSADPLASGKKRDDS